MDAALLRYHWEQWEAADPDTDPQHAKALRAMAVELARDIQTQKYDWKILAWKRRPARICPANEEEKTILLSV